MLAGNKSAACFGGGEFVARIWLWLKRFFRKLFQRKRPIEAVELPALSEDLEAELAKVDWSRQDVLVGSLGSQEQFADNLLWNYYYVPACHLDEEDLPVRYVAIYQSRNLFEEDSGIRYYAEVVQTEKLERCKVHFPVVRDNGEELYYCFRVKQWEILPEPIAIRDAWVSEPRFTNAFLLQHSRYSYELFCIRSEPVFRLAVSLRKLLEGGENPFAYKIGEERTLRLKNGVLTVHHSHGKTLDRISLEEFRETPGSALQRIKWALRR